MKKEVYGSISIATANIFFALASISVKFVSTYFDGITISLIRFIGGIILGVIIILILYKKIVINDKKFLFFRGLYGALSMITFYMAIQVNSSGRATLLSAMYPVFVMLFGGIFFKEKIKLNTIISLILCSVGTIFIFYDKSKYSFYGDLLAIISAVSAGFAVHYIKKSRENNNPMMVYAVACFMGILFSLFFVVPKVPGIVSFPYSFIIVVLLLFVVLLSFIGQQLMGYGYKYITATKGSIIGFLEIILAIFFSVIFVNEEIKPIFLLGSILILTGLLIGIVNPRYLSRTE